MTLHKSRKDTSDIDAEPEESKADTASAQEDTEPRVYELDNRGLEPPQPMVRTLNKLDSCRTGDKVVIHNDRVPLFLIEELNALGYPYNVEKQPDGSARVAITKS